MQGTVRRAIRLSGMKTFSVEGISNASMEAAMANAMAKAQGMAPEAGRLDIAVGSAVKDGESIFHVTVNVIAHMPEEEPAAEDIQDGGDEAGSRGRDNARIRRRAEEISQQLKQEMIDYFHVRPHLPSMDEALEQGEHFIESTPDTTVYVADTTDRMEEARERGNDTHETPVFDTVKEVGEKAVDALAQPDTGRVTTVMSREVDEVIGLLSLGFYEPPRPHDQEARTVTIQGGTPEPAAPLDQGARIRQENGLSPVDPDDRPMPPPVPDDAQPVPSH